MHYKIMKRSGIMENFNINKIINTITKSNKDVKNKINKEEIHELANSIFKQLTKKNNLLTVEDVQKSIEENLIQKGFFEVAKSYITYQKVHIERKKAAQKLMKSYTNLLFADAKDMDLKRDNANINGDAPMGIMLKLGTEGAKTWADKYALPSKFAEADNLNYIHIHDKDFSYICWNCMNIDLLKLLHNGFSTGHGFIREPQSIRSYAALACIAIQSNQNDMFGGQAINAFDYAMAEGVRKSFKKIVIETIYDFCYGYIPNVNIDFTTFKDKIKKECDKYTIRYTEKLKNKKYYFDFNSINSIYYVLNSILDTDIDCAYPDRIYNIACRKIEEETKQAMEAVIHNFNSLHSRAGGQVPFSSINFGTDISPEGRLVTKEILNATYDGLGNGETPIFPISIFKLKRGVNYDTTDPNYDLFKLACKVSAKRLFPNFVNIDASYNLKYYQEGNYNSEIATMGCRTRVISDINGDDITGGRGNFSFTTINLPKLALEAKQDIDKFWELLDKYITLSHDYLLYRYNIIVKKHVYNFPFAVGQKIAVGSENLKQEDTLEEVLKHCSLSIGFCGLAECLVALTGKHHGESIESQNLGIEIIKYIRKKTDQYTKDEHLNWSTFSTPAESTAGLFQKSNQKEYGIIKDVTDKNYMTNSFHIPVYYKINAYQKIQLEAPYHELCNAGHISYVEMDGDPTKNLTAFESIVRCMHDSNMGYFSINHPVDRDPICGYTGIIENECPHCHRKEEEHKHLALKKYSDD